MWNLSLIKSRLLNTRSLAMAIILLIGLVYYWTLSPTIAPVDTPEWVTAVSVFGIPHPPGYPLYVLLGNFWSWFLPFGALVWQLNLFSAVCALLALAGIYFVAIRLTNNFWAALGAVLFLCFALTWWQYAVVAEVFMLHAAIITWLLYACLRWQETGSQRWKYFILILFGLGLGNQQTLLFFLPALLYWLTMGEKGWWKKGQKWLWYGGVVVAAVLLIYAMLYFRAQFNPPLNWGNPSTLANWFKVVTRQEFGGYILVPQHDQPWSVTVGGYQVWHYFQLLIKEAGWLTFIIFIVGAWLGWKTHLKSKLIFLGLAWLVAGPGFAFLLANIAPGTDTDHLVAKLFIGSWVPYVLVGSLGLNFILQRVTIIIQQSKVIMISKKGLVFVIFVLVLILFTPIYSASRFFSLVNRRSNYITYDLAVNALNSVKTEAIILTPNESLAFSLWYLQYVEKQRPDVDVIFTHLKNINDYRQTHPRLFLEPLPPLTKTSRELSLVDFGDPFNPPLREIINGNLARRPIYVTMGLFDNQFFAYLRDFVRPAGILFEIKPERSQTTTEEVGQNQALLSQKYQYHQAKLRATDSNLLYQDRQLVSIYAEAYYALGISAWQVGQGERAITFFQQALEINPQHVLSRNFMTLLEQVSGAKTVWAKEKNNVTVLEDLANLYYLSGRPLLARQYYQQLADLNPAAKYLNNIGFMYWLEGNYISAIEYFQRALIAEPNLTLAQENLRRVKLIINN